MIKGQPKLDYFNIRRLFLLLFLAVTSVNFSLNAQLLVDFDFDQNAAAFNDTICVPGSRTFLADASFNGTKITDANKGEFIINWNIPGSGANIKEGQLNPTVSINSPGTYNVILSITHIASSTQQRETKTAFIKAFAIPDANIVANAYEGCEGVKFKFFDNSSSANGAITSRTWEISGAGTSNDVNPEFVFNNEGIFSVLLKVEDVTSCTDTAFRSNFIKINRKPSKGFAYDPKTACEPPLDVNFEALDTDGDFTYNWNIGGESFLDQQIVNKTFTASGSYTARLSIEGLPNCDTIFEINPAVVIQKPDVKFTFTSPFCVGQDITFNNNSTGGSNYKWLWGDGTSTTSRAAAVRHSYASTGQYFVSLVALTPNNECNDTVSSIITIDEVKAEFVADETRSCLNPFTVNFDNSASTYPANSTFKWELDLPGNPKSYDSFNFNENPEHDFTSVGRYGIRLIITSPSGCKDTLERRNYIRIDPIVPDLFQSEKDGCKELEVQFDDDASYGSYNIAKYNWDFGNGDQSNLKDPLYTYQDTGVFIVTLEVETDEGCKGTVKSVVEVGDKFNMDFFVDPLVACAFDTTFFYDSSYVDFNGVKNYDIIEEREWKFFLGDPDNGVVETGSGEVLKLTHKDSAMNFLNSATLDANDSAYSVMLIDKYRGCPDTLIIDDVYHKLGPKSTIIDISLNCDGSINIESASILEDTLVWIDLTDGDTLPFAADDVIPANYFPPGPRELGIYSKNYTTGCYYEEDGIVNVVDVGATKTLNRVSGENKCPEKDKPDFILFDVTPQSSFDTLILTVTNDTDTLNVNLINGNRPLHRYIFEPEAGRNVVTVTWVPKPGSTNACDPQTDSLEFFRYTPILDIVEPNRLTVCNPYDLNLVADTLLSDQINESTVRWRIIDDKGEIKDEIKGDFETRIELDSAARYTYQLYAEGNYNTSSGTMVCPDSTLSQEITVFDLNASIELNKSRYCIGDSIEVEPKFNSLNRLSYEWNIPEYNQNSADSVPTYFSLAFDTLSISLSVDDGFNCQQTVNLSDTIIIDPTPRANIFVETPFSNCPPASSNFLPVVTPAFDDYNYTWIIDDAPKNTLDTTFVTFNNPGNYGGSLIVETPAGCRDSIRRENLLVIEGPTGELISLKDTICPGDELEFKVSNGENIKEISWVWGDGLQDFSPTATDSVKSHRFEDVFKDLIVSVYLDPITQSNPEGCNILKTARIYINQIIADFNITNDSICELGTIRFDTIQVGNIDMIEWTILQENATSNSNPFSYDFNQFGIYDVALEVFDTRTGCSDSIAKQVTLFPPVSYNKSPDTILCQGEEVLLSIFGGEEYTWIDTASVPSLNNTNTSTVVANPINSIEYKFTVIDQNKCEATDSIFVQRDKTKLDIQLADTISCEQLSITVSNNSSNGTFNWDLDEGDNSTDREPNKTFSNAGIFEILLDHYNLSSRCSVDTSFNIEVKPLPDFTLTPDTILCLGENIEVELVGNHEVIWSNDGGLSNPQGFDFEVSPDADVTFTFTLTDTLTDCDATGDIEILVDNPQAFFELTQTDSCTEANIILSNESSGQNQIFDMGDGTVDFPISNYTYTDVGNYTITYTVYDRSIRCADNFQRIVKVHPNPDITVSEDDRICEYDQAILIATGGVKYQWSPNEYIIGTDSNNTVVVDPDSTTAFKVEVTNQFNCLDSAFVNVEVIYDYTVDTIPDTTIIIGETVDLEFSASREVNVNWSPSTHLSCTDCFEQLNIFPLKTICYEIDIIDPEGCYPKKLTPCIIVDESYSLDVPTGFSPNGDGVNDIVYVKGWGIKELVEFSIYNRWGEKVFTSTNIDIGWDGRYKDALQNDETYVYTVKALMWSGKEETLTGNLTLIK